MKRFGLALPILLAACTPNHVPPPAAAPPPLPAVVPSKPVITPDWRDKPYTPGTWHYADRVASYGMAGAPPVLTMRCDASRRIVSLSVAGIVPALIVRTSYGERSWPAQPGADGRSSVSFAAADPALDQIAFSRGRFSIDRPGSAEIDLPAWAEPSRVIEDCRG